MLEEEYEKSRRRLPVHLRRSEPSALLVRDPAGAGRRHPRHPRDLQPLRHELGRDLRREEVVARAVAREVAHLEARDAVPRRAVPGGQILGYALVQPMSAKSAYRYSVENSIYLGQAATGKGPRPRAPGGADRGVEAAGIHQMVAVISDKGAESSIALHEKLGFVEVGRMGRVGFKFGRWLGTIYLQKQLSPVKKKRRCSHAQSARAVSGLRAWPRGRRRSGRATRPGRPPR
jgi:phosphinothricin acetyltransferase